ncbi:hypothetical protein L210DRAFT_984749 [Boletus edulis BED1]|uniref:Uncharacterized protein n=1 Tax=Boletus edulis BED1 TaxID=1328754 RepID=A0AAD4BJ03_BOLED|nr:hypothetical protein L210DRAFT_984749 [Boletus edulis BED1]
MDVLHFEDLHVEDLAVIAPEYIALSLPLPELGEPDWWWKSPHTFREFERYISTSAVTLSIRYKHIQRARCNQLEVELNEAEEKVIDLQRHKNNGPSQADQHGNTTAGEGSSRIPEVVLTRKKHLAEEEEDDDIPSPGPSKCSNLEGKARAVTPNPKVALKELEGPKTMAYYLCRFVKPVGLVV